MCKLYIVEVTKNIQAVARVKSVTVNSLFFFLFRRFRRLELNTREVSLRTV